MSSSSTLQPVRAVPHQVTRAAVITHGVAATIGDGLARLARVAERFGVELVVPEIELRKHKLHAGPWRVMDEEDAADGADLIVVLGGDGTTLRALHRSLDSGVPVFAINYGRVGFLTTAPADELETALSRAFSGDYCVVQLPTVDVRREGERCGLGVNDAVITSALHGRMAHFQWSVNGVDLGEIGCDAVVVSTPSGSTAYSLSAGGPVLGWGLDGLVVTFVAPHSLTARSLVLPRGHVIVIENRGDGTAARIVLDGQVVDRELQPGERVTICMAEERVNLALLPEVSFLQRFRDTFAG
jgi:NAD+ kinase